MEETRRDLRLDPKYPLVHTSSVYACVRSLDSLLSLFLPFLPSFFPTLAPVPKVRFCSPKNPTRYRLSSTQAKSKKSDQAPQLTHRDPKSPITPPLPPTEPNFLRVSYFRCLVATPANSPVPKHPSSDISILVRPDSFLLETLLCVWHIEFHPTIYIPLPRYPSNGPSSSSITPVHFRITQPSLCPNLGQIAHTSSISIPGRIQYEYTSS